MKIMLSPFESGNINKRLRILKLIFNIEDSMIKAVKNFYLTNEILIEDFISKDYTKEKILEQLDYRAKGNKAIEATYNRNEFKISKFLEVASFGDLIALLKFSKPGLKFQIKPGEWSYRQAEIIFESIAFLRNKVSHSSLKPIDDHIYKLVEINLEIVNGEQDRKKQYILVIKKILEHYKSNIQMFSI